jgi:hypothetical protein
MSTFTAARLLVMTALLLGAPSVLAQEGADVASDETTDEVLGADEATSDEAPAEGAPGDGETADDTASDDAEADADDADDAEADEASTDASSAEVPTTDDAPSGEGATVSEPAPSAADDAETHAAAVAAEDDNLRRALYAGIGMGALGALAAVASAAMTAGAVAMIFAPGIDPAIATQGGPLLWFGISGMVVGAVTTAAGGGLIGWSLLTDPEEAVGAAGHADPNAATTQQNNPPMAR